MARIFYVDEHQSLDTEAKHNFLAEADHINKTASKSSNTDEILNKLITVEETISAISRIKSGKASGDDFIANDIIKSLNKDNAQLLANLLMVVPKYSYILII